MFLEKSGLSEIDEPDLLQTAYEGTSPTAYEIYFWSRVTSRKSIEGEAYKKNSRHLKKSKNKTFGR